MKTLYNISRTLRVAFVAATALLAAIPAQSRKLDIAARPYELPVFPGSLGNGIQRFVNHNFKYPAEAWEVQQLKALSIRALVRVSGKIDEFEVTTDVDLHPALYAEVKRVIEKMEWYPACDRNGRKVNAYVEFHFPLVRQTNKFATYMPIGMEKYVRQSLELTQELNNLDAGDTPVDMQKMVTEIGHAAELFPTVPEFQAANSRLLASANFGPIAVETADSALVWYHLANTTQKVKKSDDPFTLDDEEVETEYSTNFNGRAELWLATLRAILHAANPSAAADTAFADALRLADLRLADGRLRSWSNLKERQQIEKNIERYKRSLVSEWSGGSIHVDENTSGWDKVANNLSIDEIADAATYWLERGSVKSGAQVAQLAGLIQREKDKLWNLQKATPQDIRNIVGTKALLSWLRDGEEGFSSYIAGERAANPSKSIAGYLDNIEKAYTRNSQALSDRYAVLQSLACLVPPMDATPDDRKAFYARRHAVEEIFPLRWLVTIQ